MKDTIWLVNVLFILVNPGIIVIPPFTLIILIGKIVDCLAVKRVRWNKSNCFQTIHDYNDSRSVTHNWPTFDEWRIWEHDHYFHTCQEKQAFFVMFLLFIYFNVNSSYINKISTIRWGRRGRDNMVVGFLTTYAISAYHN